MSSHGDAVQDGQKVHRFTELFSKGKEKIGELNPLQKIILLIDVSIEKFIYGTSREDYFQYEFYKKNNRGRREFINHQRSTQIAQYCNDPERRLVFKNKEKFVKEFKDYIGREILNLNDATFDDFISFSLHHGYGFVKPRDGTYGRGVDIIDFTKDIDLRKTYEEIRKRDVLLEEKIEQHPAMAKFNESSLNSLRVVTFLCADGHAEVMPGALLRLGRKGQIADNFHHNGIGAQVDINTGIVSSTGIDKNGNRYTVHPDTGIAIIGFQVPLWDRVCKTVVAAAKVIPEVRYVGWDVAVTKDGRVVLIEGNDKADPDLGQMSDGVGKWLAFKAKLNEVKRLK